MTPLRRRAVVLVLAVALVAAGLGARDGAAPAHADTRPNIVLILADDLDATVTPLWTVMSKSAALLRDRGMTFTNAFVPAPDCCPARASLLLGEYPHNTGVYANAGPFGGWDAFNQNGGEQATFALALHESGYRTALIGKYLNQYRQLTAGLAPPPGWDDWHAFIDDTYYSGYSYKMNENGTIVSYGTAPSDYSTDVVAAKTLDFLDAAAQDPSQPFLAYVAPTAPHIPLAPAPRHFGHPWSRATAPALPNFYEPDLTDKPSWLQFSAPFRDQWQPNVDRDYRNRMGSLLALDDLVANVIARLEANGQLANTYLIFASDNGYELGAHHLSAKSAPYEGSIRVPLVIAGPGVPIGTEGRMVLLPDLAPTILELAGLAPPATTDMRSLAPLLTVPPPPTWRNDFLVERRMNLGANVDPSQYYVIGSLFDLPSFAAVRTTRFKLVEWYQQGELGGAHEYELYDLVADPYELDNLVKTPSGFQQYALVFVLLLQRLRALQGCSGTACR